MRCCARPSARSDGQFLQTAPLPAQFAQFFRPAGRNGGIKRKLICKSQSFQQNDLVTVGPFQDFGRKDIHSFQSAVMVVSGRLIGRPVVPDAGDSGEVKREVVAEG